MEMPLCGVIMSCTSPQTDGDVSPTLFQASDREALGGVGEYSGVCTAGRVYSRDIHRRKTTTPSADEGAREGPRKAACHIQHDEWKLRFWSCLEGRIPKSRT